MSRNKSISEVKKDKFPIIAIGNGEPCPFCDVKLDSREGYDGEDIQKHLFGNHEKEVIARLFP